MSARGRIIFLVLVLLCALPLGLMLAQAPAALSGVVLADESGARPVRQAIVTIAGGGLAASRSTITDDQGRFTFSALPEGRYTLSAAKPAHITNAYGARRPGGPGTPLTLAAGQKLADVRVVLPRGAVITGTVRDSNGEPAAGLSVSALPAAALAGAAGNVTLRPESVLTDDRGVYRIFSLAPGEYVVFSTMRLMTATDIGIMAATDIDAALQQLQAPGRAAAVPGTFSPAGRGSTSPTAGKRGFSFAPTFFPGTARIAEAGRLVLGVGEERQGVDFALQLVPTATVQGVVVTADGSPRPSLGVNINPDGPQLDSAFGLFGPNSQIGADGRFSFRSVPPGSYTVVARSTVARGRGPGGPPPSPMWASAGVNVDGADVGGLTLTLRPGLQLTGRVAFDATVLTPPADLTRLRAVLSPETGSTPEGVATFSTAGTQSTLLAADGSFTIADLLPGRYRLDVVFTGQSVGWTLRSVLFNGRDLLDYGVEIGQENIAGVSATFTDRQTELSGVLQTAAGTPAPDHFVIVFPADKALWRANSRRVKAVRPGTDGRFVVRELPGGEYLIAALTDVDQDEWNDPAFLEKAAAASVKVTLADGERKTQNLRLAR